MKYIKFCEEVLKVPESVTFWVMNQGPEYTAQYCVNMSPLEPQNFMGEPNKNSIIRSEGYLTAKEAYTRLDKLLDLLNK
jgi:hypothetical protein